VSDDFEEKTLRGISWNLISHVARKGLHFVLTIILARLLMPSDFGLLGMVTIFTGFASLFADAGLEAALVQREELKPSHFVSIFWVNLGVSAAIGGVFCAIAPLIADFYDEPLLTNVVWFAAALFPLNALGSVHRAKLKRALDFKSLAVSDLASVFISGVLGVTLAVLDFGVFALVAQLVAAALAASTCLWLISDWRPKLAFDWDAVRELLGYGSNLVGFRAFNYWSRQADDLLIGKLEGSSALGIYSKAYEFMKLPISQISAVLTRVMFPALSRIQSDKERVKRVYLKAVGAIALLAFPMMLGLLVVADHFVLALLGEKWAAVIPILRVFCIVGLLQSISTTTGWLYQSQGRTDWMFRWGIFATIVTLIAFGVGILWGVMGVVIAYTIRTALLTGINFSIAGRLVSMSLKDVLDAVTGELSCALLMGLAVLGIKVALPTSAPHWVSLAVTVVSGAVVYFATVHLSRQPSYLEVRRVLEERLRNQ
jgi:PST family polysaccharide transporter